MAHQITNFIFDIDGTLINTYEKYMPPMIDVMEKHATMFLQTKLILSSESSSVLPALILYVRAVSKKKTSPKWSLNGALYLFNVKI